MNTHYFLNKNHPGQNTRKQRTNTLFFPKYICSLWTLITNIMYPSAKWICKLSHIPKRIIIFFWKIFSFKKISCLYLTEIQNKFIFEISLFLVTAVYTQQWLGDNEKSIAFSKLMFCLILCWCVAQVFYLYFY